MCNLLKIERILEKRILNVGFVGYCPPSKFDENKAKLLIKSAFDEILNDYPNVSTFNLISGVSNVGTLKLAYEEAERRKWNLLGAACKKVAELEWYPSLRNEDVILIGETWGDESKVFTDLLDIIVRIGGGPISLEECRRVREAGKPTYEFNLERINEEPLLER